jgi:ELWxxDGT repeat protein
MRRISTLAPASLALVGCLAAAAPPTNAQPARLLADVSDQALDLVGRLVLPPSMVVLEGIVYFGHDDGVSGNELWRSDGTSEGTWRVHDICPGRCWANVQEITVVGDRLFFNASDGHHGNELWTSDGTSAGTRLVADLRPGLLGAGPEWITPLGDLVFFSARDDVHGREPWISDGTPEGTRPLGDVRPGEDSSEPAGVSTLGDTIFFLADDGVHGNEPWRSDGTAGGTQMIVDLLPGPSSSASGGQKLLRYPLVVPFDGRAWFAADDGVHGQEPWFSDGTDGGTGLAADLEPGSDGSHPDSMTISGSRLYFRADVRATGHELYVTDGTTTELLVDLEPGRSSAFPRPIGTLGDRLYFVATTAATGSEIWTSDGTSAGTQLLVDLAPGPADGAAGAWAWPALAVGDQLFFANGPDIFETELWRTDGMAAGTRLVREIWPGPGSGVSLFFGTFAPPVAVGERLFFFAAHPEIGWEPWSSDGTEAGTALVRDIYAATSSQLPPFFDFDSSHPIDAGGRLYFVGTNRTSWSEPWTSRGTPSSTHQVAETVPGDTGLGYFTPVAPLGTRLLLFVRDATDQGELWVTEEDGSGAERLATIGWTGGFGASFAGRGFFDVDEVGGARLWTSDGSPEGTERFVDAPTIQVSNPDRFAELEGVLYFFGDSSLWRTDGTPAGTAPVGAPDALISAADLLVVAEGRLFFSTSRPKAGRELWTSDGTAGGTRALPEVHSGPEHGYVDSPILGIPKNHSLVPVPGGVAFVGDDGVSGQEPWWSDGENVFRVGDLRSGARGSEPRWLTAAGGTLFFAADDGVHGRELWRWRPGEAAVLVADLVAGPASAVPQEMAGVDGVLYFAAFRPDTGVELWRSDGTEGGTVLVQDVFPGPESSTPSRPTASGRYLFFTANDGVHGREMWSLLLPTRRPRVTLRGDGALVPGRHVRLTLRLENPPPEALPDGDGDELRLPLPAILEAIEVTATVGAAAVEAGAAAAGARTAGAGPRKAIAAAAGGAVVTWNGSLPAGGAVEVVVLARVGVSPASSVALQATGGFDSDSDGTNDEPLLSDDPGVPGEGDATMLALAIEVPALTAGPLALLAAALGLLALRRLRRAAA